MSVWFPLRPLPGAHGAGVPADAPAPLPGETPWYPGEVLPVQIGVYRRLSCGGMTIYSHFDGARWGWNAPTPWQAARHAGETSLAQTLPWCGLAAPPAGGYGPGAAAPGDIDTHPLAGASDSEGGEPC